MRTTTTVSSSPTASYEALYDSLQGFLDVAHAILYSFTGCG